MTQGHKIHIAKRLNMDVKSISFEYKNPTFQLKEQDTKNTLPQ